MTYNPRKKVIPELLNQHRMSRSSFTGDPPQTVKVAQKNCSICHMAIGTEDKIIKTTLGETHDHCGIGAAIVILKKASLPRPPEISLGSVENWFYEQIQIHHENRLAISAIFKAAEMLCLPINWTVVHKMSATPLTPK